MDLSEIEQTKSNALGIGGVMLSALLYLAVLNVWICRKRKFSPSPSQWNNCYAY